MLMSWSAYVRDSRVLLSMVFEEENEGMLGQGGRIVGRIVGMGRSHERIDGGCWIESRWYCGCQKIGVRLSERGVWVERGFEESSFRSLNSMLSPGLVRGVWLWKFVVRGVWNFVVHEE